MITPPNTHAPHQQHQVVVVQQNGNAVWENGTANRVVPVPKEAPVGTMLHADCAFNNIPAMAVPELQPVTAAVLTMLEKKTEEARIEAEKAAAIEAEKAQTRAAAAAIAKSMFTKGACVCVCVFGRRGGGGGGGVKGQRVLVGVPCSCCIMSWPRPACVAAAC
jgi:hypothetical protein